MTKADLNTIERNFLKLIVVRTPTAYGGELIDAYNEALDDFYRARHMEESRARYAVELGSLRWVIVDTRNIPLEQKPELRRPDRRPVPQFYRSL